MWLFSSISFGKIKDWFNSSGQNQIYNNSFISFFGTKYKFKSLFTNVQNNELLINYFNNISEVSAPILKFVDGARQVKITSNIPEVNKLINKPNHYQTFTELMCSLILNNRLFGECIFNTFQTRDINLGGKKKPNSFYSLSPYGMGIQTSGNKDIRFNEIKKYLFVNPDYQNEILEIEPDNILHIKDSHPNIKNEQYLFGVSRYVGTSKPIQAIIEGYGAKTTLYSNGPRLIITGDGQSSGFENVNESEDIETIQDKMSKYGQTPGKYPNLVTDKNLKVFNASQNVSQLQLNENNTADFDKLCNAQGIDSKIFSYYKGSTFSNKEAAENDFYNNSFKSGYELLINSIEVFLQKWWPELKFTIDYSGIPQITRSNYEKNIQLFEDVKIGLMTRNEYLERIGREKKTLPEFNELYTFNGSSWMPLNFNQNG